MSEKCLNDRVYNLSSGIACLYMGQFKVFVYGFVQKGVSKGITFIAAINTKIVEYLKNGI